MTAARQRSLPLNSEILYTVTTSKIALHYIEQCSVDKKKDLWYLVGEILRIDKHPLAGVSAEYLFNGTHVHPHPANIAPVL